MNNISSDEQAFLKRLNAIVEANLQNEQFGVSELASEMKMSRSQIHRKLKSVCNKSVTQFIREVRLEKAKEFLDEGILTVSEIAYKVGFGSPSYFIKSFHDYFGYPPGEFVKYAPENSGKEEKGIIINKVASIKPKITYSRKSLKWIFPVLILISATIIIYLIVQNRNNKNAQSSFENTILVIPFENISSDTKQYFAVGLSNTIRTQLGKVGFKVISGPMAEQFGENSLSPVEMARQVNANYILTGDAQLQDNVILINIELSDATQGRTIWSDNITKVIDDFLSIQLEIARNVVDKLHIVLSPTEIEQIGKLQPKNFEAYNNYLMGQYFCLKRDSASILKGIGYFNEAIVLDPDYTLAYAGLADGYYALAFTGNTDRTKGYDMAYKMAEKALEKDSTLAEAYAVLGVVTYFGYWKWEEARRFFEKALAVDPNCMVAHLYYCSFLDIVGEPEKAIYHANKAIELEPYFHMPYRMKGIIYRNEKKFVESTNALNKSRMLYPYSGGNYYSIFLNFIDLKDEESAIQTLEELFSISTKYHKYTNEIKPVYKKSGMSGVLKMYIEIEFAVNKNSLPAEFYAELGMKKEALDCLEKKCRKRVSDIPRIIRKPEFENLHSNPRFQALVDTIISAPIFPKLQSRFQQTEYFSLLPK